MILDVNDPHEPFDKSNDWFFPDIQITMIPSSNLHDFFYGCINVCTAISSAKYIDFCIYPFCTGVGGGGGGGGGVCVCVCVCGGGGGGNIFYWIKLEPLLISNEIFHLKTLYLNLRFPNLTQISWRLAPLWQDHQRVSIDHCVSLSIILYM